MHTSTKNQAKGDVVLTDTTLANFDNSASVFTQKMKRWIQLLSGGLVFGLSLSMLGVTPAMAGSFTFTKIADNQGEFTSIGSSGAINDNGTVAFVATLKDSSKTLYTSDGVSNTEIANLNRLLSPFISDINNNGTVAIITTSPPPTTAVAGLSITKELFVARGGSLTNLGGTFMDRFSNGRLLDFALNQQDELAYLKFYSSRGSDIYSLVLNTANQPNVPIAFASNRGGSSDAQVDTLDSINFFDINNQGEVIFAATNKQSPPITAIFSVNGGEPTRIVETDASALRVNDKGNILLLSKDAIRLFDRSTSTLRTIADTSSGSFKTFNSYFAINNNDSVAFTATLNGGESGIFTGADPVADKVIATGDSLEGSTVTGFYFQLNNLNNLGQIAFYVRLANGEQAIYRADPVANKVIATGDSLEGSTVTDLSSVPRLNNNGQIAFFVKLANGEQAIYRADPVAETPVSQSEPQIEDGGEVNTPL